MRIIKTADYDELSRVASNIIAAQITVKPDSVLGLATGSTPIGIYDRLIKKCEEGDVDFSDITTVNLDEYCSLAADDEHSYRYFMNEHLFNHININPANTHVPNGMAGDVALECAEYERIIKEAGGIDLQLLGMGHNGHIGFNEPADEFADVTHCVDLTERTIEANKRFFDSADDVPRRALTMGIGTIMTAKKILMVVSGRDKAETVKRVLTGPVTPVVPATILRFHADVTFVCDAAAYSLMK